MIIGRTRRCTCPRQHDGFPGFNVLPAAAAGERRIRADTLLPLDHRKALPDRCPRTYVPATLHLPSFSGATRAANSWRNHASLTTADTPHGPPTPPVRYMPR